MPGNAFVIICLRLDKLLECSNRPWIITNGLVSLLWEVISSCFVEDDIDITQQNINTARVDRHNEYRIDEYRAIFSHKTYHTAIEVTTSIWFSVYQALAYPISSVLAILHTVKTWNYQFIRQSSAIFIRFLCVLT